MKINLRKFNHKLRASELETRAFLHKCLDEVTYGDPSNINPIALQVLLDYGILENESPAKNQGFNPEEKLNS